MVCRPKLTANLLIGPIFSSLDNQFRRIGLLLLHVVSYHKSSKELRIGSRFWLLTGVYNSVVHHRSADQVRQNQRLLTKKYVMSEMIPVKTTPFANPIQAF